MAEFGVGRITGWHRDLDRQMPMLASPCFTVSFRVEPFRIVSDDNLRFFSIFEYTRRRDDPHWQEAHLADISEWPTFMLTAEAFDWIDCNVPYGDWTYQMLYTPVAISGEIKFRSKEKAALFKLFWF